jgi:hypothetical protein
VLAHDQRGALTYCNTAIPVRTLPGNKEA